MTSITDLHLVVERKKLTEYLLNSAHPHGARKAAFFRSLGYSTRSWRRLSNDLKQHARTNGTSKLVETLLAGNTLSLGRWSVIFTREQVWSPCG